MKTLTLKADEGFCARLDAMAKALHLSRSEVIRQAVREYEKTLKKKRLKARFVEVSKKVRHDNASVVSDFSIALGDGLSDD